MAEILKNTLNCKKCHGALRFVKKDSFDGVRVINGEVWKVKFFYDKYTCNKCGADHMAHLTFKKIKKYENATPSELEELINKL